MKHCIDCGAELATSLDEFGEIGEERCQTCFLAYQWDAPRREYLAAQEELEDIDSDLEDLDIEIQGLREEMDVLKTDRWEKRSRRTLLKQIIQAYEKSHEVLIHA